MGEIASASTSSTPRILGPDGSVVRGGAGLMPSEVESSPAGSGYAAVRGIRRRRTIRAGCRPAVLRAVGGQRRCLGTHGDVGRSRLARLGAGTGTRNDAKLGSGARDAALRARAL